LHKEFGFSCGGGHIAFPQGTGKIAFMSFDLVSQRSLGVGRLPTVVPVLGSVSEAVGDLLGG
ncbi:MAG: hypothetical protein WCB27_02045, partial [Thermoguttaceae bacterium]